MPPTVAATPDIPGHRISDIIAAGKRRRTAGHAGRGRSRRVRARADHHDGYPATPLNLSTAKALYLYVDGFGYAPYAVGYAATVTLASGGHTLSRTVPVSCNTWNHVVVEVGSWPYLGHVTGITVSYRGIASSTGAATPWYAHFRIDDVGYTT
jgi:hypothetical protein